MCERRSMTVTLRPAAAARSAMVRPKKPDPTTRRSIAQSYREVPEYPPGTSRVRSRAGVEQLPQVRGESPDEVEVQVVGVVVHGEPADHCVTATVSTEERRGVEGHDRVAPHPRCRRQIR